MEALIVFIVFSSVVGIVGAVVWGNVQNRKQLNETIRRAIDSGQKLDADVISSLGRPVKTAAADLRGGLVLMFLAGGFVVAGFAAAGVFFGETPDYDGGTKALFIAAAIVGAIGVGQLVAALVRGSDKKRET